MRPPMRFPTKAKESVASTAVSGGLRRAAVNLFSSTFVTLVGGHDDSVSTDAIGNLDDLGWNVLHFSKVDECLSAKFQTQLLLGL